jgi:hypothetical protein
MRKCVLSLKSLEDQAGSSVSLSRLKASTKALLGHSREYALSEERSERQVGPLLMGCECVSV